MITEFLLSLVQLGEAEVRSLRDGAYRLVTGLMLHLVAMLVMAFAFVMFFLSAYWAMSAVLGSSIGALLTGAGAFLVALALVGMAAWRAKG